MQYDLEEVKKFLTLLEGGENLPSHWQMFYDPNDGLKRNDLALEFYGHLDANLNLLENKQKNLCGIYVTVNKTDGIGRARANMTCMRFSFADWDNIKRPDFPLESSFETARDDFHGHTYYRLSEDITQLRWTILQRRIAIYSGSDPQVIDPCRVLRVCGFLHLKDKENPAMYRVTQQSDKIYTAEEIETAFPLTAVQEDALKEWSESIEGIETGTGYDDNEIYVNQFLNWAKTIAPPAVQGGGTHQLYKTALFGKDRGISLKLCKETLWEYYNPRCLPVWDISEKTKGANAFDEIIFRAYAYSKSVAGCKTFKAIIQSLPPLIPRTDGWVSKADKIEQTTSNDIQLAVEQPTTHRLNEKQGTIMMSNMNDKTCDFDVANAFDGMFFDGRKILRSGKVFYVYEGGAWSKVDDDVILAKIQRAIAHTSPPNKRVVGVNALFCNHVNQDGVEDGVWLNDPDRNGSTISVYNNCMVDISTDTPTILAHTPEYFTYNKRNYDWNPNAVCPSMDAFLWSIFDHDPECIILFWEWLGCCLTPETKFQKMMYFVGVSRGGKGVMVNIMKKVIGESACASPPLHSIHRDAMLHSISDKSAVFIGDMRTPKDPETALSTLLQITGNDAITHDVKYKSAISTIFKPKMNMVANELPAMKDASGAFAKRLLVLRFIKSFYGKENLNLEAELSEELAGIAVKAISHFQKVLKRGSFTEPETSVAERQEVKDEMFKLSGFINDMCVVDGETITSSDELFKYYKMYCSITNVKYTLTQITFNKELKVCDLGLETKRRKNDFGLRTNYYKGIRISGKVTERFKHIATATFTDKTLGG